MLWTGRPSRPPMDMADSRPATGPGSPSARQNDFSYTKKKLWTVCLHWTRLPIWPSQDRAARPPDTGHGILSACLVPVWTQDC